MACSVTSRENKKAPLRGARCESPETAADYGRFNPVLEIMLMMKNAMASVTIGPQRRAGREGSPELPWVVRA